LVAGGAFFGNAATTVAGFWSGAAVGAASGFAGGFTGAALNTLANGGNIGDVLTAGFRAGVQGAFIGGAVGGIAGGIKASKNNADFWSGKKATVQGIKAKAGALSPMETDLSAGGELVERVETVEKPAWPTKHRKVTSDYNPNRVHPVSGKPRPHTGTDFRSYKGDPNYSLYKGRVTKVYTGGSGSGGNYIKIEFNNGLEGSYFHTRPSLSVGDLVSRGQIVGVSDGSGIITAPHLHLSIKIDCNDYINPMDLFN